MDINPELPKLATRKYEINMTDFLVLLVLVCIVSVCGSNVLKR